MTRARMPRPHEVAAARRDPRLLRAVEERQTTICLAHARRVPDRRSGDVLSGTERAGRRGGRALPDLRRPGRLPGLGAGGRRLPRRLGRHHAARTPGHAGRLAQRRPRSTVEAGRATGCAGRRAALLDAGAGQLPRRSRPADTGDRPTHAARCTVQIGDATRGPSVPTIRAGRAGPSTGPPGRRRGLLVARPRRRRRRRRRRPARRHGTRRVGRRRSPWPGSPSRTGWPGGARPRPRRQLDEAWTAVVAHLRADVGGRACRWSSAAGPAGPGWPAAPRGRSARSACWRWPSRCTRRAGRSGRGPTSCAPACRTLVVNGDRDPFGVPLPVGQVRVEVVARASGTTCGATRPAWPRWPRRGFVTCRA